MFSIITFLLLLTLLVFTHFNFFPPVLYLLSVMGWGEEGLVVVLWTDETTQRCFLKPGTTTWLQILSSIFPGKLEEAIQSSFIHLLCETGRRTLSALLISRKYKDLDFYQLALQEFCLTFQLNSENSS